jgi:hypothetical protein
MAKPGFYGMDLAQRVQKSKKKGTSKIAKKAVKKTVTAYKIVKKALKK